MDEKLQVQLDAILKATASGNLQDQLQAIQNLSVTVHEIKLDPAAVQSLKNRLSNIGIDAAAVFGDTKTVEKQTDRTFKNIFNNIGSAYKKMGDLKKSILNMADMDKDVSNLLHSSTERNGGRHETMCFIRKMPPV